MAAKKIAKEARKIWMKDVREILQKRARKLKKKSGWGFVTSGDSIVAGVFYREDGMYTIWECKILSRVTGNISPEGEFREEEMDNAY
jgi:hypothetical protein